MAARFYYWSRKPARYPASRPTDEAPLETKMQKIRERLQEIQKQVDTQLSTGAEEEDEATDDEDDVTSDDACSNSTPPPSPNPLDGLLVPAKFSRRLVLPTHQQLYTAVILRLNQIYHAESEFLDALQNLVVLGMLSENSSDEEFIAKRELPQVFSAFSKALRRYVYTLVLASSSARRERS